MGIFSCDAIKLAIRVRLQLMEPIFLSLKIVQNRISFGNFKDEKVVFQLI